MKLNNVRDLDKQIKEYIDSLPKETLLIDLMNDKKLQALMNQKYEQKGVTQ